MADDDNNHEDYRSARPRDPTVLTLRAIEQVRREIERLSDLKLENVREDIRRLTRQVEALEVKIDGLRERIAEIARKNWSVVGAYIVGAVGVASLVVAAVYHAGH